jgi:hypothetical protein
VDADYKAYNEAMIRERRVQLFISEMRKSNRPVLHIYSLQSAPGMIESSRVAK